LKFISFFFLLAIILLVNVLTAHSQGNGNTKPPADTLLRPDTLKGKKPPKGKKSSPTSATKNVVIGKDTTKKDQGGLESEAKTTADSTVYDTKDDQIVYLYGNARVTYNDFELDANYIKVNKRTKLIFASGTIDPKTKHYTGRPISKQGKDDPLTSDSLLFNYDTKKGHIWNPSTRQQENYITHGEVKKLNDDEVAYRNIIFTTCDKPNVGLDPDFGIVITRGIGEKKQIISGPAYLEIEGVPIPIAIPFGFFPKTDTRTSGFILPEPGEDQKLGFYLRGFGYYLGLSDYADLTTTGTYYTNNSYEINTTLAYRDRYRYTGNLSLSYGSHNYGLAGDPAVKDFNVTWSHSQNPNSSPGSTFSASVNAGTSTYYQNNPLAVGYNIQALTQNSLRSSIAYGKTWQGTPFNLTVSLSHSQDLTNKTITLELPTFNFSMATINPFDSKDRVTEQKWYQKITIGYNLTGTNKLTAIPESQLFQSNTLKKMQNGLNHTIPISMSLNVFKYFQFNTNVNYSEQWYFQTIRKHYARADSLVTDTVPGFQRAGEYSVSAGLSTKLYSTATFGKDSWLKAIRHVMTPSISFSYRPDYTGLGYAFNKSIVSAATIPYPVIYQQYSIFDGSVYNGPSGGRQAGISLSLDNTLEAKIRRKSTDTATTDKKVSILEGFSISTFYNFAADSFRLTPISFSGHTSFLNNRLSFSFGGVLNPYKTSIGDSIQNGQLTRYWRPVNRFTFQDGRLPTLSSFNISASISLNPTVFHPTPQAQPGMNTLQNINPQQAAKLALINSDPNAYVDFNMPYNITLNYQFTYSNNVINTSNTNTVNITGDLNITPKWKVSYTTNFDLKARQLSSATSFTIYRDLHCWNLAATWLPFGFYKSYNVTLRVNSAILQDLKLSKKTDYTSSQYFTQ